MLLLAALFRHGRRAITLDGDRAPGLIAGCAMRRLAPADQRHRRLAAAANPGDADLVTQSLMFPQLLPMAPIALTAGGAEHAPAVITGTAIVTLAVAVAVMAGLWLLVEHSRFGRAMRAHGGKPAGRRPDGHQS